MKDIPWMPVDAVTILKDIIKQDFEIFEWGSGGSTLFFSQRAKNIISIEYDKQWFNDLFLEIKNRNITNINLIYQFHDNKKCDEIRNPDKFTSFSRYYNKCVFESYVKTIDKFGMFDLIIVDGRARISCFKRAIFKLKKNGFILIDDMEREHYSVIYDMIPKNWKLYFNNGRVKIYQNLI
jgi:hypothetical protein